MLELINAVVIDDDIEHLVAVTNALGNSGISSFPVHFDDTNRVFELCEGVSKSHPRIIITDIQVIPSAGPEPSKQDFAIIGSCVEKLVANNKGPYVVMAWTDKSEHLQELKAYVQKYLEKKGLHTPVFFECISKNECKDGDLYNVERIFEKFSNHLDNSREFRGLLGWERAVNKSAHATVDSLVNTAGKELKSVLHALGVQVAGNNLEGNESAAINESLIYILRDEVSKESINEANRALWEKALENSHSIKALQQQYKFSLNSLLHLDNSINNKLVCPGDVWMLRKPREVFKVLCSDKSEAMNLMSSFKDDVIVFSEEGHDLDNRIKVICNDLKEETVQSKKDKISASLDKLKKELSESFAQPKNVLQNASEFVTMEVSPQCDFSNNKKSLKSLILGLLIPAEQLNENITIKSASSLIKMPLMHEGKPHFVVFSAKYIFSFSEKKIKNPEFDFNKIFRIRESLLQSWVHSFSSYNSRIGTVSFS